MAIFPFLRLGLAVALAFGLASAALAQTSEGGAKQRIVVIGDSLAEGLAPALADALADIETIEVQKRGRGSSGFVRDDYYNWPEKAREIVAEGPAAAMVMLIGINDRQAMQVASGRAPTLSEAWRKEYVSRVDNVLNTFKQANAKIYWVGLPPMPPSRVSSDMAAFNEIFRERVAAAGGKFIDIWDGFANDDGRFTPVGPDLTGSIRRLRASDGVHFSRTGYEKLAHFVEQEIRTEFAPAGPPADVVATPEEPPTPPADLPPIALMPPPGDGSADGNGADARPKPGPVIPLTGAGVGEPALVRGDGETTIGKDVVLPKPGRADDFPWPR